MTLADLLKSTKPGETIIAPDGPLGDITLRGLHFDPPVTIKGGLFRSITLIGCGGLHFRGARVRFTPTATSQASTPAVFINASVNILLDGATLIGGVAIAGTAPDATVRTAQDAVIGQPTGQGVSVFKSSNVVVSNCDISGFDRGVGVGGVSDVVISGNHIHDLRRTAISGGGVQNLTIQRNRLGPSRPWNWGKTPLGDHADYIAIATNPSLDPKPSKGVRILDNLMDQGEGTAILGMWLQGQYGDLGFIEPEIARNTLLIGNSSGITVKGCVRPFIHHNTLLQSSGGPKDAPQIMWFSGTVNGLADANTTAAVSDLSGSKGPLANTAKGTIKPPGGIVPLGTLTAARAPFLASPTPFTGAPK